MELIHKPLNLNGAFSWVTYQRINLAVAFAAGLAAGFWWGNGHTTQNSISHVANQLGTAEQLCERNRWVAIDAGADPKTVPACPK